MIVEPCQTLVHLTAAGGRTVELPRQEAPLVGLLYLYKGQASLGEGEKAALLTGQTALLYAAWQPQRLAVQADTAALAAAFCCEEPQALLNGWARRYGPVQDCRALPGAAQILPRLELLFPGLEQGPALRPVSRLFGLLLEEQPEQAKLPGYLHAMRRLIDTRYAEDLTLESLAAQVGRSRFHLSRAFREAYQMTPGEYLTHVRLTHAARLLVSTSLPVKEIGRQVGIPGSAYFTVLFKQHYGCPPREYRLARQAGRGR